MFSAMVNLFRPKPLTRTRILLAVAVAVVADGAQFAAGPFGWVGFDQAVDVVAMLITSWLLGFHFLLLPTFVLELVPVVGELPTWTGCVGAVILLRKRTPATDAPPVQTPPSLPGEAHPPRLPDAE